MSDTSGLKGNSPRQRNGRVGPPKRSGVRTLEQAAALHQGGELEEAERLYRRILKQEPRNADAIQLLGVIEHQRGNNDEAVALLTKAIEIEPGNASAHNNLGGVYSALGEDERAAIHFAKAAGTKVVSSDALTNLGILRRRAGDLSGALAMFQDARAKDRECRSALRELASLQLHLRNYPEAEEAYKAYVELVPEDLLAQNNLGYAIQQQGRYGEAEACFQRVLETAGNVPEFGYNLRISKILQGQIDEAEGILRAELEADPDLWVAEVGLAMNIAARGHADRATELLRLILKILPDKADAWTDIGLCFVNMKKIDDAIEVLQRAVELNPDESITYNALGCAYTMANFPSLAIGAFKAAISRNPDFIEAYSNVLRALRANGEWDQANMYGHLTLAHPSYKEKFLPNLVQLFRGTCDFEGLEKLGDVWAKCDNLPDDYLPTMFLDLLVFAREHDEVQRFVGLVKRWAAFAEKRVTLHPEMTASTGSGSGKLRIGFLSSDLRSHSVARFLAPLLKGYDKERFEFYCYMSLRCPGDPIQETLKGAVDRFTFVDNKSGWEIAKTIRDDRIDILFDLNGFTEGTMIDAMAFKPAPVQASWLGYPFTCGLSTIDYVVMDRFVVPRHSEYLVEEPIVMPDAWVCFGNFAMVDILDGVPMDRAGRITFGTQNNPYKYTPHMIGNWARVLQRVPNSRFLIVRPESHSRLVCRSIVHEFERHGIGADRIFMFDNRTDKRNHLAHYNEIDISLDTFPLTGGTTTCEATWMGVPVVSLVGESFHQRISYSALMHCGLEELCTFDDESFVDRAVALAGQRERLVEMRHGLRDVMSASPLCDKDRFIYQFQEMLEQVARHHNLR